MSEDEVAGLRDAAQTYIDGLSEYRRMSMEAHVWAPADETMWTATEPVRAALSGVPEGAASEEGAWLGPEYAAALADHLGVPVLSPEPLDVERLAEAMLETWDGAPARARSIEEWLYAWARVIAARLAAPQPVPEDES